MSQAATISVPPPSARPLTAAMTGFIRSKRWLMPAKPVGGMIVGIALGARFEIAADAEGAVARAGQHGDAQLRLGRERVERRRHLAVRQRVQRVERGRAIDGDPQDRPLALGQDVLVVAHLAACLALMRPAIASTAMG